MAHIRKREDEEGEVEFGVIVEGTEVCHTDNLSQAVCLLMAAHYVFNLEYNKKVVNTLSFLQKVILNVSDDTKTPSKVVRLVYDLNAIIEKEL